MISKVRRAREYIYEKGLKRFFLEVTRRTYIFLRDIYWDAVGGTQSFTIAGTAATFDATSTAGGEMTRKRIKYEKPMLEDFLRNLKQDDVIFDVGANIGLYSCFASNRASRGEVFAIEPYPPNFEQLRRNIRYNRDNIVPLNLALSDTTESLELRIPEDAKVGTGNISIVNKDRSKAVTVDSYPGDSLVRTGRVSQPTVVKIDVEGAEGIVIDGMKEILAHNKCRLVYFEFHLPSEKRPSIEDFDGSFEEVKRKLEDLGYETRIITDRADELQIKAGKLPE